MSSKNFGEFLTKLASEGDCKANSSAIENLKVKMEMERQDRIEAKLRQVFTQIERNVGRIRDLRRQEAQCKAEVKKLEKQAQDIVDGNGDVEPF